MLGLPLLALLVPLRWVLPAERVLEQMEQLRRPGQALRVDLRLEGAIGDWPGAVALDLHPEHGVRISDDRGGRFVLRHGRVVGANLEPLPEWLPDLEVLALPSRDALLAWLQRVGVNSRLNELGRFGDLDCFVLGGRRADHQLWLDKEHFDVVRIVLSPGRIYELGGYRSWGKLRFPSEVRMLDELGAFATFSVERVQQAPRLTAADFDPAWAETPASR